MVLALRHSDSSQVRNIDAGIRPHRRINECCDLAWVSWLPSTQRSHIDSFTIDRQLLLPVRRRQRRIGSRALHQDDEATGSRTTRDSRSHGRLACRTKTCGSEAVH